MKSFSLIWYLLVVCLFSTAAYAGDISRSFSSSSINADNEVDVNLEVSIGGGDSFYIIEEYVPEGWTIVDAGSGDASGSNVIFWITIQNPASETLVYKVKAPSASGSYEFKGNFTMGSSAVRKIGGESIIEVSGGFIPTTSPGGSTNGGGSGGSSGGTPQCRDGVDNDMDGLKDYPSDPGCLSANDNDELNAKACQERWICDEWGECSDGVQTRECADTNNCGSYESRPALEQECFQNGEESANLLPSIRTPSNDEANNKIFIWLIAFVVLAVFISAKEFFRRKRLRLIREKHSKIYNLIEEAENRISNEKAAGKYYDLARNEFEKHKDQCGEKDSRLIEKELLELYEKIRKKHRMD